MSPIPFLIRLRVPFILFMDDLEVVGHLPAMNGLDELGVGYELDYEIDNRSTAGRLVMLGSAACKERASASSRLIG